MLLGAGGDGGSGVGPSRSKGRGSIGSLICVYERAAPKAYHADDGRIEG